jgi:ADP-ribose pyrophosphatase YjhB (NUDIX family)
MGLVRESLITEKKQLELSAGLAIIQKGTILLGHPKGQEWYGTYSIPKGHVEEGEDILQAAIRETREEVGITVDINDVIGLDPYFIDYKDKNGELYKRVYYYIVNPAETIQNDSIRPDKTELDWAGFILKDAAEVRIFWRLKPILDHINEVKEMEGSENYEEEVGVEKVSDTEDESI